MYGVWILVAIFSIWQWYASGDTCLTSGRFPNDDVPDCRGYVMCIASGNGGFFQYNLTCPQSFVFSPLDKVCTNVTNYHCGPMHVPFDCPSIGNFENALSIDCSTYIACNLNYDNTVSARVFNCPRGFIFNAVQSDCVNGTEYDCATDETTVPDVIEVNTGNTHTNSSSSVQKAGYCIISLAAFAVISAF